MCVTQQCEIKVSDFSLYDSEIYTVMHFFTEVAERFPFLKKIFDRKYRKFSSSNRSKFKVELHTKPGCKLFHPSLLWKGSEEKVHIHLLISPMCDSVLWQSPFTCIYYLATIRTFRFHWLFSPIQMKKENKIKVIHSQFCMDQLL